MLKKDKLLQMFNWVRLFDFVVIHLSGQSGGRELVVDLANVHSGWLQLKAG